MTQLLWNLFRLPAARKRFIGSVYLPILEPTVNVVTVFALWIWQKLMKYEINYRSLPQPLTPVRTPKRDLQQMLMEENTPLRDADQVHSESHEKKHMAQIEQANRMICQQGKDIENQGGSPCAVVVIQVDYWAVSHAIGIVGVMYQIASTGGARIATAAGLLSTGSKKANWWIPSNEYVIK